jgi:hypothetical protein
VRPPWKDLRPLLVACLIPLAACSRFGFSSPDGSLSSYGGAPDLSSREDGAYRSVEGGAADSAPTAPEGGAQDLHGMTSPDTANQSLPDAAVVQSCLTDMILISQGVSRTGYAFCIDILEQGSGSWLAGELLCASDGKRYCSLEEWRSACDASDPPSGMIGNWEWVADLPSPDVAYKVGYDGCNALASHDISSGSYTIRCCVDVSQIGL